MGCTSPEPTKPLRALHPTFGGEVEAGCTLDHCSIQVWLHYLNLWPKPGSNAKLTL